MKKICLTFLACTSIIGSVQGFYPANHEELVTEELHAEKFNKIEIEKDSSHLSPDLIQLASMKIDAETGEDEKAAVKLRSNDRLTELANNEKKTSLHAARQLGEAEKKQSVKAKNKDDVSIKKTEIKENAVSAEEERKESVNDTVTAVQAEPEKEEVDMGETLLTEKKPTIITMAESTEEPEAEESEERAEPSAEKEAGEIVLTMTATAYTADCEGGSGVTYTGIDLKANPNVKVIAVDPSVIPLGTEVYVEGYGYAVAADIGGAIKGNKIDVFIPSQGEAEAWGIKTVNVTIKQ